MVGGITKLIYLPARLTQELGYFKDEGLNVELLSQPAGVDAENELLAGAVQAVVGFYDHTIDLQSKGKEIKAIVVFGQVPGEVEMVASKQADTLKSMGDVKGKTLGVTPGSVRRPVSLRSILRNRKVCRRRNTRCCQSARITASLPRSSKAVSMRA